MFKKLGKKVKNKKGFTLIELIVVIAILGILAMIAIPKIGGFQDSAKLKADVASAKTVANQLAVLVANGDILTTTATKTWTSASTTDADYVKLQAAMNGGKVPVPQLKGTTFTINLDSSGNITITNTEEVYPTFSTYKK